MKVKINPTRVELLKLKKRHKTAKRGHKLLKEKRDGLMKDFLEIVRQAKTLRQEMEKDLADSFFTFSLAASEMFPQALDSALALSNKKLSLQVETRNIMNIKVPVFNLERKGNSFGYGFLDTTAELDISLEKLDASIEKIVKMAEVEKSILLLAEEIEKTRRRVNSLEYVLIPTLKEGIREITMKLDEQERGNLTRLMKVKAMLAEANI